MKTALSVLGDTRSGTQIRTYHPILHHLRQSALNPKWSVGDTASSGVLMGSGISKT